MPPLAAPRNCGRRAFDCWSAEARKGEQAPLRNVAGQVNVADFGAKGDGKTDDTEAFQKAIDAVTNAGGKVIVPVGQFRIEGSVRIKDGVTVAGLSESWLVPGPLKRLSHPGHGRPRP